MNRRMYASVWVPTGGIDVLRKHQEGWQQALDFFKPLYIADEGGGKNDTPFVYCCNRGHFYYTETDNYPDPVDPEQLATSVAYMVYGVAYLAKNKIAPFPVLGVPIEPFTSFFPEIGPNINLLLRKIRKVFDPNGVAAPGRQVFNEEEFEAFPNEVAEQLNSIRAMHDMEPVKAAKEG